MEIDQQKQSISAIERQSQAPKECKFYYTQFDKHYQLQLDLGKFGRTKTPLATLFDVLQEEARKLEKEKNIKLINEAERANLRGLKLDLIVAPEVFADLEEKRVNERLATNAQELQEVVNEAQIRIYKDAFELGGDETNLVLQLKKFASLSKSLTMEKEDYFEQNNTIRKPFGTITQELGEAEGTDQKFIDLISYQQKVFMVVKSRSQAGPMLQIYQFDIKSGQVGENILTQQLQGGRTASHESFTLTLDADYKSYKQLGKFVLFWVVENHFQDGVQALELYKFNLITFAKTKVKEESLKDERGFKNSDCHGFPETWSITQYVCFMHSSRTSFPKRVGDPEHLNEGDLKDDEDALKTWLENEIVCLFNSSFNKPFRQYSLRQASNLQVSLFYSGMSPTSKAFQGLGLLYISKEDANRDKSDDSVPLNDFILLGPYYNCLPTEPLFYFQSECKNGKFVLENVTKTIAANLTHKEQFSAIFQYQNQHIYTFGIERVFQKRKFGFLPKSLIKMTREFGFIRQSRQDPDLKPYLDSINLIYLEDDKKYVLQVSPSAESGKIYSVKSKKPSVPSVRYTKRYDGRKTSALIATAQKLDAGPQQLHPYFSNLVRSSTGLAFIASTSAKTGAWQHEKVAANENMAKYLEKFGVKHNEANEGGDAEARKPWRLQTHNNDRTVWPRLHFSNDYRQISIEIWNSNIGEKGRLLLKREVLSNFKKVDDQYLRNFALAYSSAIELMNEQTQTFRQNFVVTQTKEQIHLAIREYQLTWSEVANERAEDVSLQFIGMKTLLFRDGVKATAAAQRARCQLFPYYPDFSNYYIDGIYILRQLRPDWHRECIMKNFRPEDYQFKGQVVNTGYKIYVDEETERDMEFLLVESCLSRDAFEHIDQLSDHERSLIFEKQLRVVLNMVPADLVTELSADEIQEEDFDFLAPLELLNGNCLAMYTMLNPNDITRKLESRKTAKKKSLIEQLFAGMTIENQNFMIDSFQSGYIRQHNDVWENLFLPDPIRFGLTHPDLQMTISSCRKLIEKIMTQKRTMSAYGILMGILPWILEAEEYDMREYGQFFTDYAEDQELNTFCFKIIENDLPKFSNINQNLIYLDTEGVPIGDYQGVILSQIVEADCANSGADVKKGIPINHFMISFEERSFNEKLNDFVDSPESGFGKGGGINEFELSTMLMKINQKFGQDIEQQPCLRAMIDFQYEALTRTIILKQLLLYTFGFVIPFLTQLFAHDPIVVRVCVVLCIATQTVFFAIECLQIHVDGFAEYISDMSNKTDLSMFTLSVVYAILRCSDAESTLPAQSDVHQPSPIWTALAFCNVLFVIQIVVKVLFFMKLFEKFGMLVQLIVTCLADVIPFTVFLCVWILAFTLVYKILGASAELESSYPRISELWQYCIQTWEDSIGNILSPTYEYWIKHLEHPESRFVTHVSYSAIYLVWFVWWLNQFLVLVILLNFLIAVISQSYENVMNRATQYKYTQRCELNREATVIYEALGWSKSNKVLVLSANTIHHSDGGTWAGFVQTLKSFIRGENHKLGHHLANMKNVIEKAYGAKEKGLSHLFEKVATTLSGQRDEIRQLKASQAEINKKMATLVDQMVKLEKMEQEELTSNGLAQIYN